MSDLGKLIGDDKPRDPQIEARLHDLQPWDDAAIRERAAKEGIELTAAHREVLEFLRNHYLEHGLAKSGRELVYALEEQFGEQGGRRHLYELFPHGPVTQGTRIAGVPQPAYTTDPSFGSSE